jgi:hypothetical protein
MKNAVSYRWSLIALFALLAAIGLALPGSAQTIRGQARAVQASVLKPLGVTTTVLADTGTLVGSDDVREAAALTGSVPLIVTGTMLHATTIGWPDQVNSEASLADLSVKVGAITLKADFVMARASAVLGVGGAGIVNIEGLSINGLAITVTRNPNQTIAIPRGRVVINEQVTSAMGTIVNALHIAVTGVAEVVVASAMAGVR